MHVFAKVGADQDEGLGIFDVGAFVGTDFLADRENKSDFTWSTALGVGWCGNIVGAERFHGVFEKRATDAVAVERHRLRAVIFLDLVHLFGDVGQRFIPGDFFPFVFTPLTGADERVSESVFIKVSTDAAGSARAESTVAERVHFVAFDFLKHSINDGRLRGASPETNITEGWDDFGSHFSGIDAGCFRALGKQSRCTCGRHRGGRDFQEVAAIEGFQSIGKLDFLVYSGECGITWLGDLTGQFAIIFLLEK